MINAALRARTEQAKRRAHGHWKPILERLGVDPGILEGRNRPCPGCGGKDRFQFTDKFGDGNYICRGCGPGDGLALLELCRGWKFIAALKALEDALGAQSASAPPASAGAAAQRMRELAARIWQEAKPVEPGDAVATYLARRGIVLAEYPQALRTHPALGFYVRVAGESRARPVRTFPAMLATVQGPDGRAVSLHRTYLEHGAKAPVAECKKLLHGGVAGAAVRLFEPTDELALAEGIETALAVHVSTGKPVWAALCATNLAKLWLPEQRAQNRHLRRSRRELHRPGRGVCAGQAHQEPGGRERPARGRRVHSARRRQRLGRCAARSTRAGGVRRGRAFAPGVPVAPGI